jgi:hypothetical protein
MQAIPAALQAGTRADLVAGSSPTKGVDGIKALTPQRKG